MAITISTDPVILPEDAAKIFNLKDEMQLNLLVNSLTEKFKRYTGRVQISANATTAITERLPGSGTGVLYLSCAPLLDPEIYDISAAIYIGSELQDTLTYSGGDLQYYSDNYSARLIYINGTWPNESDNDRIEVTYKAGLAALPGDVLQGAVLQGRVDLRRLSGEVGMPSRSAGGETTSYETGDIIKAVADLWYPYRVLP